MAPSPGPRPSTLSNARVLGYVGVFWRVLACSSLSRFALLLLLRFSPFALRVSNSLSRMQAKLQLHDEVHTHTQLTEKHISSLVADKHRHSQKQERKKKKKPTKRPRERDAHAHVFVCKKGGCFGWHYCWEKDALRVCLYKTQLEREENSERERKSLGGRGGAETHVD